MKKLKSTNSLSRRITKPYGYSCKFCGKRSLVPPMESVVTKRKEHIWFHRDCFKEYVRECNN